MNPRAMNPTGSSLLGKSSAKPGSIDRSIFDKKNAAATGQGTVSSDYLQKTREDNPAPEAGAEKDSVSLSGCRITTPADKLVPDQPFEMSVSVEAIQGNPTGPVTFNLFCTLAKPDGSEDCQDQSAPSQATVSGGIASAKGTLFSPKTPVEPGTLLKYHVVAGHPEAKDKAESPKVEVKSSKTPGPLAEWSLGAVHFGFDSSFVLPGAAGKLAEFNRILDAHPGAAVAVFGHADPTGDDEGNKKLSGRRAYSVLCLLSHHAQGWDELSKGADGDKWDLRATQTMLAHLKSKAGNPYYGGSIDGKSGPKTQEGVESFQRDNGLMADGIAGPATSRKLHEAYMASLFGSPIAKSDFVGDPQDAKRQWACVGCGEFNPVLVFSKADDERFCNASDKSERNAKNAPNRRATVMLFPESAKGPGKIRFPCPAWSEGAAKCKPQLLDDAEKRRNPSDSERSREKDMDTFACGFYAGLSAEGSSGTSGTIEIRMLGPDGTALAGAPYTLTFPDGSKLDGTTDGDGCIRHSGKPTEGELELVLRSSPA